MDETLLEENNVDTILGKSLRDGLVNFEAKEATPKLVDDGAPAVRSRLAEIEPGKRKSRPTECWLAYQTSSVRRKKKTAIQTTQEINCSE